MNIFKLFRKKESIWSENTKPITMTDVINAQWEMAELIFSDLESKMHTKGYYKVINTRSLYWLKKKYGVQKKSK